MEAMLFKGRVLLLGGTRSERRRGSLDKHGRLVLRNPDPTGLKKIDVQYTDGTVVRTPHGNKIVATRRRANKVAKLARKANR